MLRALAEVAERTDSEHPYLGTARLRKLEAELERRGTSAPFDLCLYTGIQRLLSGDEQGAIDILERTSKRVAEGQIATTPADRAPSTIAFHLGVAYLRLAESQNCCATSTRDGCILPIQGDGIHVMTRGSERAITCFTGVLEDPNAKPYQRYSARWLLNLAAMTLGEHPAGVPDAFLIPADAFRAQPETQDFPRLLDRAEGLGIDRFNLSGGVVADDLNGDGLIDLMTSTWDTRGSLSLFLRRADGAFEDVSEQAGLAGILGGLNLVQADYDNDGDLDILVLRGAWLFERGRHPNSLLQNDGRGNFIDVTFDARLGDTHYPTQTAAFADYDLDGDLDLYIGNESSPRGRFPCQLFRNNGDGTFTETTRSAGVENFGYAKSVTWGDYDNDGDPDLYVSNNGQPNRLYRNDGRGRFSDVAPQLDVTTPRDSFPCWFWDYDNDGHLDLFVASYDTGIGQVAKHYLGESARFEHDRLYRGLGGREFEDVGIESGLTYPSMPMGSNFGDLDNDGLLDMYLGTGNVHVFSLMPNLLLIQRDGRFIDTTIASGLGHLQKGHGVAFADFDADGDLDLFTQLGGAYPCDAFRDALYENPGSGNDWICIQCVGTRSNRCAIGARIRIDVVDQDGEHRSIHRLVGSGGSFGASPLRQTIGLGRVQTIERIQVRWPVADSIDVFETVSVGSFVRLTEGVLRAEDTPYNAPGIAK